MEVRQFSESDDRSGGEIVKKNETEGGVRHGNDDERKKGRKDKSDKE